MKRGASAWLKGSNTCWRNRNLMAALANMTINLLIQAGNGLILSDPVFGLWA